jgi:hypothetical protein
MFSRFTIRTRLSPSEAEEVLWRMICPRRAFLDPEPPTVDTRPFEGRVEDGSFKCRRVITERNSFLPIVSGRVMQSEGGAVVQGHMRLAVPVAVMMALWMAGAITAAAHELPRGIRDHDLSALGVSFFPIFGVLLTAVGFYPERRKALRLFTDALQSSSASATP